MEGQQRSSGSVGQQAPKQVVTSNQQQLEELEAKLRATEHRLSQVSRGNSPARQAHLGAHRVNEHPDPTPSQTSAQPSSSPLAARPIYSADRPPTAPTDDNRPQQSERPQNDRVDTQAMMQGMPGAMPQTPRQYSNSGDYVMVDRNADQAERTQGYGQSVR
ncbi:hypothetical protein LTR62_004458 [Meristemomyces frigidus]|uniref:Uncharacterized protein n=1 Tax=Meristemomyces frigidus TaxID=1508187 RepID=A0AAN7YRC7_9PEZI|nr:hypothetical protein LTR62_004458 [Meristemomyces frigidus]